MSSPESLAEYASQQRKTAYEAGLRMGLKTATRARELAEERGLVPDWKRLAVHALHDLRAVGVPIEKISGVTPEVIAAVDEYDREMESFT